MGDTATVRRRATLVSSARTFWRKAALKSISGWSRQVTSSLRSAKWVVVCANQVKGPRPGGLAAYHARSAAIVIKDAKDDDGDTTKREAGYGFEREFCWTLGFPFIELTSVRQDVVDASDMLQQQRAYHRAKITTGVGVCKWGSVANKRRNDLRLTENIPV